MLLLLFMAGDKEHGANGREVVVIDRILIFLAGNCNKLDVVRPNLLNKTKRSQTHKPAAFIIPHLRGASLARQTKTYPSLRPSPITRHLLQQQHLKKKTDQNRINIPLRLLWLNDPSSTAVKGKNPPRMVPATPKGGGRQPAGGRVTRSAVKGSRASSCQPVAATAMMAQTPSGRGRAGGGSRVTRSAIKGKARGDGGARDASPPPTSIEVRVALTVTVTVRLTRVKTAAAVPLACCYLPNGRVCCRTVMNGRVYCS